jgi:hypothetical protein
MIMDQYMQKNEDSELVRPEKKPYTTPVMKVYGDMHAVTQTTTMTHKTMDGAMVGNTRT